MNVEETKLDFKIYQEKLEDIQLPCEKWYYLKGSETLFAFLKVKNDATVSASKKK